MGDKAGGNNWKRYASMAAVFVVIFLIVLIATSN